MQLSIIQKKEEPLLSRTMLKADIEFEKSTPSYAEVTSVLATALKSDEKLIAIKHIYNSFGSRKAQVIAYLYSDENKKQLIEPKIKEGKGKKEKAKAQDKK